MPVTACLQKQTGRIILLICTSVLNLFFIANAQTSSMEKIEQAQKRGTAFLKQIQRTDGAICDTINPLFETWETILAATALYKSVTDTNHAAVRKATLFLKKNENNEGLICHNIKCSNAYCLETTAAYFNLLQISGNKTAVQNSLNKIAALQKQTGEWEIGNPDVTIEKSFPSVTAFVLNLFADEGANPEHRKEAIDWLIKKQTTQGDWGSAWEYYGCSGYALWQVLKALRNESSQKARLAKEKAIAFITATQHADGSWYYRNPAYQKQTSPELQTVLMLLALQGSGAENDIVTLKGINFLLARQQKNGSWNGGFFPIPDKRYVKEEYVFVTALAIELMQNYLLYKK